MDFDLSQIVSSFGIGFALSLAFCLVPMIFSIVKRSVFASAVGAEIRGS